MEQIFSEPNNGDLTIDEMMSFSGQIQLLLPSKLIRISKSADASAGKMNLYIFERVPRPNHTPVPLLIKVKDDEEAQSVTGAQLKSGKKVIFDATVFMENEDARVLGFR